MANCNCPTCTCTAWIPDERLTSTPPDPTCDPCRDGNHGTPRLPEA